MTRTAELQGEVETLPDLKVVSPNFVKKIVAGEYVDIWELLPETWHIESKRSCCHASQAPMAKLGNPECYATMAAIFQRLFLRKHHNSLHT